MLKKSRMIADDGDIAFIIYSLLPTVKTEFAVAANGDISGETDDVADSTLTVDLSTPAATLDTLGEVVDYFNSLLNSDGERRFKAILVDALREDSSDDTLLTFLIAVGEVPKTGLKFYKDTSVALNLSVAITNQGRDADDIGMRNSLGMIVGTNTYGSGTNKFQVYRCFDQDPTKASEKLLEVAAGGTGVETTWPTYKELSGFFAQNARLLVRMIGSAACTGSLMVDGKSAAIPAGG
jgi:hypothetical protein